jgi:uncharacterized protein YjdB
MRSLSLLLKAAVLTALVASCSSTAPKTLSQVVIRPSDTTLIVGQTAQLRGSGLDANNDVVATSLAWTSSNTSVLTVDATGHVSTLTPGSATVTASLDNISGTSVVTVNPPPVAHVQITPSPASVEADHGTRQLTATATDASGRAIASQAFTWTSANNSVATVDQTGLVTGLTIGSVTISALAIGSGVSGADSVAVTPPSAESIAVSLGSSTLLHGQTTQATATLFDGRHNIIPNSPGYPITWTTSNAGVATVDGSGTVTAAGAGSTFVTATSQSAKDSAQITVLTPVAKVGLSPNPDTITVGQTGALTVVLTDAGGNVLAGRTVTWTSNNASVVSVDPSSGVLSAVATGNASITATSEGQSSSATVYAAVPWMAVSAGFGHTCALTTANYAYCWGFNGEGELGDGTFTGPSLCGMNPCSLVPVAVSPPAGSSTPLQFQKIGAGEYFTCGITLDSNLYCWGNINGYQSLPVQIPLTGVNGQLQVLSVGDFHACVTTINQYVYCFGQDTFGQLGTTLANGATFSTTLVAVNPEPGIFYLDNNLTAGGAHTCGTPYGQESVCWGSDQYGQLGAATTNTSCGVPCSFSPIQVTAPPTVFAVISAGEDHTCGIGQSDGATYCWGHNSFGQLGNGTERDTTLPTLVARASGSFVTIRAGTEQTCALDGGGYMWCWGLIGPNEPTQMTPAIPFTGLAVGSAGCGLTAGGAIYCAGDGTSGEDGNNSPYGSYLLVRVLAPADPGLAVGSAARIAARPHTAKSRHPAVSTARQSAAPYRKPMLQPRG